MLVKRPEEAFAAAGPALWHYTSPPDLAEARREHEALLEILRGAGAEVVEHSEPQPGRADAIFVFDPVKELQNYVKREIALYKYPRAIESSKPSPGPKPASSSASA